MLVDEFMVNYKFATKREINQGFQDKYHKGQIPLHTTKTPLLHHENNNACVTKVEETLAIEHREKEDGNNKAGISYIYHTLRFNEVLYKTLT